MAGLRSRWTTPSAWLAASASAIWAVSRAAATGREGAVLAQVAVQVGAVDEVHDQGEQIALDDQVAGAHDVRVGQPEQDGALAQEAHHDVRVVRELLLEDLDRDGLAGLARHGRLGARGLPLAGSPDGARGAASERLLEQVLAAYRPHVMRSLLIVLQSRPTVVPSRRRSNGRLRIAGCSGERRVEATGRFGRPATGHGVSAARVMSRFGIISVDAVPVAVPHRSWRSDWSGRRRWTARARPFAHRPRQSRSLGGAGGTRCQ